MRQCHATIPQLYLVQPQTKQRQRLINYVIGSDQQPFMFESMVVGGACHLMVGIRRIGASHPPGCIDKKQPHRR
jgi:hypothetical protein